jgi:hypothetical protein
VLASPPPHVLPGTIDRQDISYKRADRYGDAQFGPKAVRLADYMPGSCLATDAQSAPVQKISNGTKTEIAPMQMPSQVAG